MLRDTIDTPLTAHEFFKILQPLVTLDGHTTLQFTGTILPEVANPLLPFETVVFDNHLYVKNNLSADSSLKKGTEILHINGKDVRDILKEMLPYLPGERLEYKFRKLANEAFPNWYRLIYGNFERFTIDCAGPEGIRTIMVEGAHWNQFPKHDEEPLKLSFPEENIAYLKVGSFRRPKEFLPFIDSSFTEIKNRKCGNLILDITEGGGFTMLTDSLLSYITSGPHCEFEKKMIRISRESKEYIEDLKEDGVREGEYFVLFKKPQKSVARSNRFKGKVYVLTGPRAYSASTMFAAMAKCYSDAIIVGEETGQPLISNADISRHKLPDSSMYLYTSHSIYYFPCALNRQEGVKPDIEVKMSLNDLLNDHNKYLEYTVGIINSMVQREQPVKILKGHEWSVTSLDINEEGDLLLSGAWDNSMFLWDLNNDSILYKFDNHSDMIWDVTFSSQEQYIASASWDASINIWDIESRKLVHKFKHAQKFTSTQTKPFYQERIAPNMINCVAFSPDDSYLASGSSDGMIRIWDLQSGELTETIDIHDSVTVNSLLFNPSGTRLISSSDKIKIYDVNNKTTEMILDGHHGKLIGSLDLNHSGELLASGDIATRDPLVVLWDPENGDKIREFKGHRAVIRDIAFSNDGSMIASVGEDNLIILWSVHTGEPLVTFTDNDKKELNAICFTRDDRMIIYGSQDKTIKFRNIESYTE